MIIYIPLHISTQSFRSQDNLDYRPATSHQLSGQLNQLNQFQKPQQSKLRQPSAIISKGQDTIVECSELDDQADAAYYECNHDETEIKDLKNLIEKLQCVRKNCDRNGRIHLKNSKIYCIIAGTHPRKKPKYRNCQQQHNGGTNDGESDEGNITNAQYTTETRCIRTGNCATQRRMSTVTPTE